MSEPKSTPEAPSPLRCSFCQRTQKEAGPLVEARKGTAICYRCVMICKTIHEAEYRRRGIDLPGDNPAGG